MWKKLNVEKFRNSFGTCLLSSVAKSIDDVLTSGLTWPS